MFLMIGQNGHTPFPWNLPIWQPDYAVFFGVLYLVLLVLCIGLGLVIYRTSEDLKLPESDHGH